MDIAEILRTVKEEYSCIGMNIKNYVDILNSELPHKQSEDTLFYYEPCTDPELLRDGYYGSYLGLKIFVHKSVPFNNFWVSNQLENTNSFNQVQWEPLMSLW